MSSRSRDIPRPPRDSVELLLRRALRRALSGSALISLGTACTAADHAGPLVGPNGRSPRDGGTVHDAAPVVSLDSGTRRGDGGPSNGGPSDGGLGDGGLGPAGPAVMCPDGSRDPLDASGLKPAQAYDYLAIRRSYQDLPYQALGDGGWAVEVFVISETGTLCKTASSDACQSQAKQETANPTSPSVLTTRGDEVRRWAGPDDMRTLLGAIDSFDDALLLVSAAGYDVVCNDPVSSSISTTDDGYIVYALETVLCPFVTTRYKLHVSRAGQITQLESAVLTEGGCLAIGRKPAGLRSESLAPGESKLGDFLARCAHLEAASVFSFTRLMRELQAHGAPRELLERAAQARADEVRHAEQVGALALRHGGALVPVDVEDVRVRSLEEIARENAVEGCVRETYGALVGAHQAMRAEHLGLRRIMVGIAEDEARHAALSHAVHAWLVGLLDAGARERIREAQVQAIIELAQEAHVARDTELTRAVGLPNAPVARRLVDELMQTLWRAPLRTAA